MCLLPKGASLYLGSSARDRAYSRCSVFTRKLVSAGGREDV